MNFRPTRLTLVAAAFLLGSTAFAANSGVDYDHSVDFRSFHTFSFYKVQTAEPFLDQRIKDEITTDLGKAGYTMVPTGGDLSVTAFEGEHDQTEYNTFYNGLGGGFGYGGWRGGYGFGGFRGGGFGGGGFGGGDSTTTVEKVPVGTLVLDMYSGSSKQLVWRGQAASQLSTKADKNTKKFDKDIDHMLNGFPPKSKS